MIQRTGKVNNLPDMTGSLGSAVRIFPSSGRFFLYGPSSLYQSSRQSIHELLTSFATFYSFFFYFGCARIRHTGADAPATWALLLAFLVHVRTAHALGSHSATHYQRAIKGTYCSPDLLALSRLFRNLKSCVQTHCSYLITYISLQARICKV